MKDVKLDRRKLLTGAAIGAGGMLSGCDVLNENETFRKVLHSATDANFVVQRSLGSRMALAREYSEEDRSPTFRANGTTDPDTPEYNAMAENGFVDWRLKVTGMVENELDLSLAEVRALPQRTQITRHDCVEGWSAIGKWQGVPLTFLLDEAKLADGARFIVFHCADIYKGAPYYESVDLVDARHPQTIIAHMLNDEPIPVANGAPLRMRIERQLGYKHAKYVHTIEAVDRLDNIHGGKGGLWEDRIDYAWYAGI